MITALAPKRSRKTVLPAISDAPPRRCSLPTPTKPVVLPRTFKSARSSSVQGPPELKRLKSDERRASFHARSSQRKLSITNRSEQQQRCREPSRWDLPFGRSTWTLRKDVRALKNIFNEYDLDGDQLIQKRELEIALKRRKELAESTGSDWKQTTLSQRRAARGFVDSVTGGLRFGNVLGEKVSGQKGNFFLIDQLLPMFEAADADGSGAISFLELLRVVYPKALDADCALMASWVEGDKIGRPGPTRARRMSSSTCAEVESLFRMYDLDNSGTLSPSELAVGLKSCGLTVAEIEALFSEQDADGDGQIDLEEFTRMMESTGIFYDPDCPECDSPVPLFEKHNFEEAHTRKVGVAAYLRHRSESLTTC